MSEKFHEKMAERLIIPVVKKVEELDQQQNPLGTELSALLFENLRILESDNWQEKAQQAKNSLRAELGSDHPAIEKINLEQLRAAMILVLVRFVQ